MHCGSNVGRKISPATCGVPQGSVQGRLMWLIMYDGMLTLCLPINVTNLGILGLQ